MTLKKGARAPGSMIALDSSTVHSSFQAPTRRSNPQALYSQSFLNNIPDVPDPLSPTGSSNSSLGSPANGPGYPNRLGLGSGSGASTASETSNTIPTAATSTSPVVTQNMNSNAAQVPQNGGRKGVPSALPVDSQGTKKQRRTRIACIRCRSRKQKCDGIPLEKKCSNCEKNSLECSLLQLDTLTSTTETIASLLGNETDAGNLNNSNGKHESLSPNTGNYRSPQATEAIKGSIKSTNDLISSLSKRIQTLKQESEQKDVEIRRLRDQVALTSNTATNPTKRLGDTVQFNSLVGTVFPFVNVDGHGNESAYNKLDLTFLLENDAFGVKLVESYFELMHIRFPVFSKRYLTRLHENRAIILNYDLKSTRLEQIQKFKLLVVYAIGLRLLYLTKKKEEYMECPYRSDQIYIEANRNVVELTSIVDLQSIRCLLLDAMFTLRSYRGYMLWNLTNIIMKYCIELNLYRKEKVSLSSIPKEKLHSVVMSRRIFWSCYVLDRLVSINFGKPFSLGDSYIDCELPFNINDDVHDPDELNDYINVHPERMKQTSDMSLNNSLLELRKIDSLLQISIYRVDKELSLEELLVNINYIYEKVEAWKRNIPTHLVNDRNKYFVDLQYHKTIRILLLPLLGKEGSAQRCPELVRQCFTSSGEVCIRTKAFLQHEQHAYSFIALNNVFTAGLTLIYGLWNKKLKWDVDVSVSISACSTALFIIAERMPRTKTYLRDVFENLLAKTLDKLSEESNKSSASASTATTEPVNKGSISYINATTSTPNDITAAGGLAYLVSAYEQQKRANLKTQCDMKKMRESEGMINKTIEDSAKSINNNSDNESQAEQVQSPVLAPNGNPNTLDLNIDEFDELWNIINDQKSETVRQLMDGSYVSQTQRNNNFSAAMESPNNPNPNGQPLPQQQQMIGPSPASQIQTGIQASSNTPYFNMVNQYPNGNGNMNGNASINNGALSGFPTPAIYGPTQSQAPSAPGYFPLQTPGVETQQALAQGVNNGEGIEGGGDYDIYDNLNFHFGF